ncbi:DUF975 family protein [Paenibacillus psychroresistens]|uniref:DUF975 family protein n=1 Tax=Paenibacillus psychroresistens TaxID=1778678 RepID=A0A6B8RRC4_9BACL|nr:DUF975 family protein [Paenibacillus psychroresistens]QGQ98407.1 DUF975 family protein [Paenibacillus psychroresistens]
MWTRKELKEKAKQVLRTSYWKAFLVSLVLAIISGGIPSCSFNSSFSGSIGNNGSSMNLSGFFDGIGDWLNGALLVIIIIFAIIAGLIALAFRFFLIVPLEVGVRQYFKQAAQEDVNMNYLGYSFKKEKYLAIVKGMFWSAFLNFLWFLLLIVPGIVKAYSYSLVPYILADNANIGTKRAIALSIQMTRGQKWNMFVLDLSFIGWYLLGTLACGIGVLFVFPYVNSTEAELYLVLRQQALDDGVCTRSELNLMV